MGHYHAHLRTIPIRFLIVTWPNFTIFQASDSSPVLWVHWGFRTAQIPHLKMTSSQKQWSSKQRYKIPGLGPHVLRNEMGMKGIIHGKHIAG